MQYGIIVPNLGDYSNPRALAELARDAEASGWDGFFIWDHVLFDTQWMPPIVDPWVVLSAAAMNTERIRLGTLVTPLPRRRPWKLARETVTLDHLSHGRLTLGAGVGYPPGADFEQFGEEADTAIRAAKLDEGLEVLAGLWSGEPFSYDGKHYHLKETVFLPTPVQSPRIPVWVAGVWPNEESFVRAARWDGVCSLKVGGREPGRQLALISPDDLRAIVAFVQERRTDSLPFDVVLGGSTLGDDPARAAEFLTGYAEAGLTWWVESFDPWNDSPREAYTCVRQGPPRV